MTLVKLDPRQTRNLHRARELLDALAKRAQVEGIEETIMWSCQNAATAGFKKYPGKSDAEVLCKLLDAAHEVVILAALIIADVQFELTEEHSST